MRKKNKPAPWLLAYFYQYVWEGAYLKFGLFLIEWDNREKGDIKYTWGSYRGEDQGTEILGSTTKKSYKTDLLNIVLNHELAARPLVFFPEPEIVKHGNIDYEVPGEDIYTRDTYTTWRLSGFLSAYLYLCWADFENSSLRKEIRLLPQKKFKNIFYRKDIDFLESAYRMVLRIRKKEEQISKQQVRELLEDTSLDSFTLDKLDENDRYFLSGLRSSSSLSDYPEIPAHGAFSYYHSPGKYLFQGCLWVSGYHIFSLRWHYWGNGPRLPKSFGSFYSGTIHKSLTEVRDYKHVSSFDTENLISLIEFITTRVYEDQRLVTGRVKLVFKALLHFLKSHCRIPLAFEVKEIIKNVYKGFDISEYL